MSYCLLDVCIGVLKYKFDDSSYLAKKLDWERDPRIQVSGYYPK